MGLNAANICMPTAALMFLGQTGVGKSETAKATARVLFKDSWQSHFLRIDCASLSDPHDIKRIQGAASKLAVKRGRNEGDLKRRKECSKK